MSEVRCWQLSLHFLQKGNLRFAQQKMKKILHHDLAELVQGQQPYAVILSCSDSRVSPDIIFDCSLGDLFIIQNAGNICDASVLGSIQYAVQVLKIPLIAVIGHTECGAVSAAHGNADLSGPLQQLVSQIQPHLLQGDVIHSIEHHAVQTAKTIEQALQPHQAKIEPEVNIIAGLYHLDSGSVEWLNGVGLNTEILQKQAD